MDFSVVDHDTPSKFSPIKMPEVRVCLVKIPEPSPVTSKPTPATTEDKKFKWITEDTHLAINQNLYAPDPRVDARCRICDFAGARRRVRVHLYQHFTKSFCTCKFMSPSRNQVYEHQRRRGTTCARQIYDVDEASYSAFTAHMKWTSPPAWQPCQPTTTGEGRVQNQRRPILERLAPYKTTKRSHPTNTDNWNGYTIPKRRVIDHAVPTVSSSTRKESSKPDTTRNRSPERRQRRHHHAVSDSTNKVTEHPNRTPLELALGRRPTSDKLVSQRREFQRQLSQRSRQLEEEARYLETLDGDHFAKESKQLFREARRYRKAGNKLD